MTKSLTIAAISVLALITPVFGAGNKDAIPDKEKAIWQTVQDKKFDACRKNFASDYRGVYAEGLFKVDQEMDCIQKADLKSYSISDSSVFMPGKDTVLLTYKATMQATQDGKDMSGRWNCASVWHKFRCGVEAGLSHRGKSEIVARRLTRL